VEYQWPTNILARCDKSIHVMLKYDKIISNLMFEYSSLKKDSKDNTCSIHYIIASIKLIYNAISQLYKLQYTYKFALDNYIRIQILESKFVGQIKRNVLKFNCYYKCL